MSSDIGDIKRKHVTAVSPILAILQQGLRRMRFENPYEHYFTEQSIKLVVDVAARQEEIPFHLTRRGIML